MATPPEISSILPSSGPVAGGTQVLVSGSGLSTATGVAFGALSTTQYVVDNDSLLFVISPPATEPGPVPVIVITPSGNSVPGPQTQFNYQAAASSGSSGGGAGASTGASSGGTSGGTSTGSASSGSSAGSSSSGSGSSSSGAPAGGSAGGSSSGASTGGSTGSTSSGSSSTSSGGSSGASSSGGSSGASGAAGASTTGSSGASGSAVSSSGSGASSSSGASGSTPPPSGNYIPGGTMIVPGGQTGLGGTAGTGTGFGVGTLMAGGGGSAPPSNLPYYVDPAITAQLVQSLIGIVQNAASPDALEAQNIILRRMALQGDVIGSRIPPPRNISEIGGYLNLLSTLKENAMREQTLAGILGVAGPSQPLGFISNTQPLAMVAVTNDRPPVAAQPSFPLTVLVRSDFVGPVQNALSILHTYGATLPLVSPPVLTLPPGGTGTTPPTDILFYLGRTLVIAPSAALNNPAGDPVALLRPTGTTQSFALACNILNVPTAPIPTSELVPPNEDAVQCSNTSQTVLQLPQANFVLLAPILAAAGYYPASPFPVPANSTDLSWTRLANTTGLVAGATQLGDELSLLYRQDQINNSVFAAMLNWTWNGTAFAP